MPSKENSEREFFNRAKYIGKEVASRGYIERSGGVCFHGRLGPELQEIVGKYSQHQEIDGGERCNELAGNGKLTLQCHWHDMKYQN